jgi:tetratricopeptide (TPR) repeat protein
VNAPVSDDAPQPAAASPTGLLGRLRQWSALHRKLTAIGLAAALLCGTGLASSFLLAPAAPHGSLPAMLAALEQGDMATAYEHAQLLRQERHLNLAERSAVSLVLGTAVAEQALDHEGRLRQRYATLSIRHLEAARRDEFPAAHRADGFFLLGRMYLIVQRFEPCVEMLQLALQHGWPDAPEVHRLLAEAYVRLPDPQPDRALQHIEEYLNAPLPDSPRRRAAILLRARIRLLLGEPDLARSDLDLIAPDDPAASEAMLLHAQAHLEEARHWTDDPTARSQGDAAAQQSACLDSAIDLLTKNERRFAQDELLAPQAEYLLGLCYRQRGEVDSAAEHLTRVQHAGGQPLETVPALLHLAELAFDKGNYRDVAMQLSDALQLAGPPQAYSNPWLPLGQFRSRVLSLHEKLLRAQKFSLAVKLAERLEPLFPPPTQVQILAETHAFWARSLLPQAQAGTHDGTHKLTTLRQARAEFLQAAGQYARLARLRFDTRLYPDDLWNAAQSYLAGRDFAQAILYLEAYRRHEDLRRARPEALVLLGEAHLAQGQTSEAIAVLRQCFELHARHPSSYKARLLCSKTYQQLGKHEAAEKLLLDNLNGDELTPASPEWRESLLDLGRLLQHQQRWDDSIVRLEEWVQRYPHDPQRFRAEYLLAESYRQLAHQLHQQLDKLPIASVKQAKAEQARQALENALLHFERSLPLALERQAQAPGEEGELQQAILRNCHFARAAVLLELGRYQEAITACTTIIQRYATSPEVLEAYVRIAAAQRALNMPDEARRTILRAKLALERLPPQAQFTQTTSNSRQEWAAYLDWLADL